MQKKPRNNGVVSAGWPRFEVATAVFAFEAEVAETRARFQLTLAFLDLRPPSIFPTAGVRSVLLPVFDRIHSNVFVTACGVVLEEVSGSRRRRPVVGTAECSHREVEAVVPECRIHGHASLVDAF